MKTAKQQRPAAKPEYQYPIIHPEGTDNQLDRLHVAQVKPPKGSLVLTVVIPPKLIPMFTAMAAVTCAESREGFAAWAICKGMICEEAMNKFDELVNAVL
jgi:hypothetical protein